MLSLQVEAAEHTSQQVEQIQGDISYQACWYHAKLTQNNQQAEFSQYNNCANINTDKQLKINPRHLNHIEFAPDNLAVVSFNGQFFYLNQEGHSIQVVSYDNWADDFNNGLARTQINGKIGYIDRKLELIIPADYDWGFPFNNGQATVCIGCKFKSMGEHKYVTGGLWGVIDVTGNLIKPFTPK